MVTCVTKCETWKCEINLEWKCQFTEKKNITTLWFKTTIIIGNIHYFQVSIYFYTWDVHLNGMYFGTGYPINLQFSRKQIARVHEFPCSDLSKLFLDHIVTCKKKKVLYDKVSNWKEWLDTNQKHILTLKWGLHPCKILPICVLDVWSDHKAAKRITTDL